MPWQLKGKTLKIVFSQTESTRAQIYGMYQSLCSVSLQSVFQIKYLRLKPIPPQG